MTARVVTLLLGVAWAIVLGLMYAAACVGAVLLLGRAMDNV